MKRGLVTPSAHLSQGEHPRLADQNNWFYSCSVARTTENSVAWVAGGLALGLGLIAMASSSRNSTRLSFHEELRSELAALGLRLVSAELGLLRGKSHWVVACEMPDGRVLRAQVPVIGTPYDMPKQVASDVAGALARA